MSHGREPLRPNTKLLQTSRSCVIFTASPILRPIYSVMLSNHHFGCVPQHRTPSTEPNSTLFSSRLSGMRHADMPKQCQLFVSDGVDDSPLFVQLLSDAVIGDFLHDGIECSTNFGNTSFQKPKVFFHLLF